MIIELPEQIEKLIEPLFEESQLELVGVTVKRRGAGFMIDIFADRPAGGITMDECAAINKKIANKIEEDDFIKEDYLLAVSSPGLDWPLKTKKDFLRAMRREVRFFLSEAVEEKIEYAGIISRVEGEQVVIEYSPPKTKGGKRKSREAELKEVIIPIGSIKKAIQII